MSISNTLPIAPESLFIPEIADDAVVGNVGQIGISGGAVIFSDGTNWKQLS